MNKVQFEGRFSITEINPYLYVILELSEYKNDYGYGSGRHINYNLRSNSKIFALISRILWNAF